MDRIRHPNYGMSITVSWYAAARINNMATWELPVSKDFGMDNSNLNLKPMAIAVSFILPFGVLKSGWQGSSSARA